MPKRSETRERKPPKAKDVAVIVDRTDDLEGFQVIRQRAGEADWEFGTLRPLKEGKAIDGELVSLRPRKHMPFVYDVKTELPAANRPTTQGPAQIASRDYRNGWDAIWGRTPAARPGAKPN